MKQKGFVLIPVIVVVLLAMIGYLIYENSKLKLNNGFSATNPTQNPSYSSTPLSSNSPTSTPNIVATLTPTPTPTPTPDPSPSALQITNFRKVLAEFEKYIGVSNTAGALQFFTPPTSDKAKAEFEKLRTTNLPFRLTYWSFFSNDDGYLFSTKIQNGYKMTMTEGRDGVATYLIIELVRDGDSFLIDRYYHSGSNVNVNHEDLKYQGFSE